MSEKLDARDVDCEACGAAAGENCLSLNGPGIIGRCHPARVSTAKAARS